MLLDPQNKNAFLQLQVDRNDMVRDTIAQLTHQHFRDFKKPLRVSENIELYKNSMRSTFLANIVGGGVGHCQFYTYDDLVVLFSQGWGICMLNGGDH